MTEQVHLPPLNSLVRSPSKTTQESPTKILAVTNDDGELIENGGTSKNGELSFVGSAEPNQKAEVLDWGVPVHPPVNVDNSGHYSVYVSNLARGEHGYSVRTSNGQESDLWRIFVDVPFPYLQWIAGPDGMPIDNGGSTFHRRL